jgi:outer membrane protein
MLSMRLLPSFFLLLLSATISPAYAADVPPGPGTLVEGETLEDFFTAAIKYSPRLQIAEENFNIGGFRERQARGQLLPQVNANASLTDNRRNSFNQFGNPLLDEFDGERLSLTLSQALFNWQAWSARKRASLVENQLEAEYYYELAFLLTDVAERYLNVLRAEDALTSIASELEAITNQRDQIQTLYDLHWLRLLIYVR